MSEVCSICGGSGLRVVQENGRQFAQDCVCRVERRAERMLGRAHIPKRYEHCTLENYETNFPSSHRTLGLAHLRARKFVEGYPLETAGTGLLLTGSLGVGKKEGMRLLQHTKVAGYTARQRSFGPLVELR